MPKDLKTANIKKILSIGIIIGSINYFAAFFNYLFRLISGKYLSVGSFGQFESLTSLNTIVGSLIGALGPPIILLFSNIETEKIKTNLVAIEKRLLHLALPLVFVLISLYPVPKFLLKIQFWVYIVWIFQVFLSVFYLLYTSVFQSKLKLIIYALSGLFFSIFKNIFSVLLAILEFRDSGPYVSPLLSMLIITIALKMIISKTWPSDKYNSAKVPSSFSILKYSISTLMTNTFLVLIISQDIFVVRYYFSEIVSGLYSSTSIIGKIIFFAVSPLTAYLFPVFIKYRQNTSKLRLFFLISTAIITFLVFLATIIFKLFPDTIIGLLLGVKFIESAKILPAYAIFISIYSVFFHFCYYFLSQESSLSYKIPILVFLTQSLLLFFFHQDPQQVVAMSTTSIILVSVILFVSTLLRQLNHRVLGRLVSR